MTMQPSEPFIVENNGGIAWLTLNRPEKHNAMDLDFFAVLPQHFQILTDDSDVRVVVIKAAGKSFSAGTDLSSAAAMVGSGAMSWWWDNWIDPGEQWFARSEWRKTGPYYQPGNEGRETFCHGCHEDLDGSYDPTCPQCGWIKCTDCGSCGCNYR